jgi:hypothetical protein
MFVTIQWCLKVHFRSLKQRLCCKLTTVALKIEIPLQWHPLYPMEILKMGAMTLSITTYCIMTPS